MYRARLLALGLALGSLAGCGAEVASNVKRLPPPPPNQVARATQPAPPLKLSAALDNRFIEAGQAREVVARLRITTAADLLVVRAPVNLGIVIDTSGSMAGKAIAAARKAALAMVKELRPGDRIAIVTFDSKAQVLLPSTQITGDSGEAIAAKIGLMKARGTTDMAGGLSHGLDQVRRAIAPPVAGRPQAINRLVLLSDGNPNDTAQIVNLARHAQRSNITITALGLGFDYNETLLGDIASTSGGIFKFIDDPAKVASVFRDEVIRMRQIVAQNIMLQIQPGPGVLVKRVYGYAIQRHHQRVRVPIGTLVAEGEKELLIRMSVSKRSAGASVELMDATVSYVYKSDDRSWPGKHDLYLSAKATDDQAAVAGGRTPGFAVSIARAEAAQGILDAIAAARSGNLARANQVLDAALTAAREAAKTLADGDLVAQVNEMVKLRSALPSLVPAHLIRNAPGRAYAQPVPPDAPATIRKSHSAATKVLAK